MESLQQNFQTQTNTTIDKMKDENDDKYNRMNEKITTIGDKADNVGRPKQQRKRTRKQP